MKIIPCTQLSANWFQAHCGVVSGSSMGAVLDFTQKGAPGSKRRTYFRTKLAELLTGVAIQDNYVSKEMLEGIEREPLAIAAYERQEGVMCEEIGFALHDVIPRFGCSPDRLVGKDGLVEAKCPKAGTHLQWVLDGCIPAEHLPQLRAELSVTGRDWVDFVSFCPEVPKPLQLMVIRFERSQADLEPLERAVMDFNAEIAGAVEKLRGIAGPFDLPAQVLATEQKEDSILAETYLTDEEIAKYI
mgnify:CR=1 FL=1